MSPVPDSPRAGWYPLPPGGLVTEARTEGLLGKGESSQLGGSSFLNWDRNLSNSLNCAEVFTVFIRGRGLRVHAGEGSPAIFSLVNEQMGSRISRATGVPSLEPGVQEKGSVLSSPNHKGWWDEDYVIGVFVLKVSEKMEVNEPMTEDWGTRRRSLWTGNQDPWSLSRLCF